MDRQEDAPDKQHHDHAHQSHHHHHHNRHNEDAAPLPMAPHTTNAYGDWSTEVDASAPFLADHLYGNNADEGEEGEDDDDDDERQLEGQNIEDSDSDSDSDSEVGDDHLRWVKSKVWYKRPDEKWLRPLAFLLALASGMVMGPKVEMYYSLVCEELGITSVDGLLTSILPPPSARQPVSSQCHKSPIAEASQVQLQLRLTLALGILSVITTGYWGGLSDRKGRIFVLRLAIFGLIINDFIFLIVGFYPQSSLPFGKNFLVLGSAFEGCLGGFATLAAGHQAYIADVTPNGTRTNIFSTFTGIIFFGFFLGPSFGGWMSKMTNSLTSPFYFTLATHVFYFIFLLFILPESVSLERRQRATEEYGKNNQEAADSARMQSFIKNTLSFLVTPLRPLALFLPHRRHDDHHHHHHHDAAKTPTSSHISVSRVQPEKLDWNLTFLAIAFCVETSCYGVVTPKMSYAISTFDWGPQQIGYYLSFSSMTRVISLALLIPLFIKWLRKPLKGISLPHDGGATNENDIEEGQETRHLLDEEGRRRATYLDVGYGSTATSTPATIAETILPSQASRRVEKQWTLRARHLRQIHDSAFDKKLAFLSLSTNGLCFLFLALSRSMGSKPFLALTGLVSLGGAAPAAMSSLALALLERDSDAGKLFAAWSIISAISTTVVGPIMFSELFAKTVSSAPESIFVLASGELPKISLFIILFFLSFSH